MDGHEFHLVGFVDRVRFGKEGDMCEEIGKGGFFAAADLVLQDGLLQFGDVVEARLVAFCPQHGFVAGGGEELRKELGDRHLFRKLHEAFDEGDEGFRLCSLKDRIFPVGKQRLPECFALGCRGLLQEFHPLDPQIPLRLIGYAAEGKIVLRRDHAQVGEGILHLGVAFFGRAAVDRVGDLPGRQLGFDAAA